MLALIKCLASFQLVEANWPNEKSHSDDLFTGLSMNTYYSYYFVFLILSNVM